MPVSTDLFGSQFQATEAETPFQLLLEQHMDMAKLGSHSQAEAKESHELFNELHTLLSLLLQLSKDDVTELFGPVIAEKFYFEFANWQLQIEEQTELPFESLFGSLLTLINVPVEHNGDVQTLPLQSMNEEAKNIILRLLHLFKAVSQQGNSESTERLVRFQKHEGQIVTPPEVSKLAHLRKVISETSESGQRANSNFPHSHTDDTGNRFVLQPNVTFQQTSMDRIHQLEWRIQLLNETDATTLVKQFEKILTSSRIRTFKNGLTELNVRLHPEHLGSLSIKLTQQDGNLIARIVAQTEAAKSLLESQLHQLRHAFVTQNIQVEKVEILSENNAEQHHGQDSQANPEQHEEHAMMQRDGQEENDQNEEEQSFKDWLQSLLL